MSRERLSTAIVAAGILTALVSLIPAATAHPYHLMVANEVLMNPQSVDPVDSANWIAQSFATSSGFFVSRVSLFVSDVGTTGDALDVSIRTTPAGASLAQGSVVGSVTFGWTDVDVSPWVPLNAASTYLIVVHSTASSGNGYGYWNSGLNLGGTAQHSSDGLTWTPATNYYPYRVYGFVQPSWSFSASRSAPAVAAGQTVVFTADFTNSGPGDAAALWVNFTLPPEVTYASDDASSIGGSRTGTSFAFTTIVPGSYSFNVTASAKGGVPDGTVVSTDVAFDGKDHNGATLTTTVRTLIVTIQGPRLSLSLVANASAVNPGDTIALNATVTNTGAATAISVLLDGTVDVNATFVSCSAFASYVPATRTVSGTIATVPAGGQASLDWVVGVPPGTSGGAAVRSDARATYRDGNGTLRPQERASTVATVRAPAFTPVLRLDRSSAERGDEVAATLYFNNTGSTAAARAVASWSLGGNYVLVALVPVTPTTPFGDGFNITWTNVAPGAYSIVARLQVIQGMLDGLPVPISVRFAATDGNGNPLPPATLTGPVTLRAPAPVITLSPPIVRVVSDGTFTAGMTVRNSGGGAVLGWLNLTLPAGLAYVDDNVSLAVSVSGNRVSWTIPLVPPGSMVAIGVGLRATGPPATAVLRFTFNYTDGKGSPAASLASNSASVEVLAAGASLPLVAGIVIAVAAGVGLLAWFLIRRRRGGQLVIDDAFVVNEGGILLAHRSSSFIQYQDQDILMGMFKVVQDFVKDSFSRGLDEDMQGLEFGDRKVLIEKGKHHFVAVVYRGAPTRAFRERVRGVSQEIDEKFGDALAHFTGALDNVRGITLLLPRVWGQAS